MQDEVELLERLTALWNAGTVTDQEFAAEKRAILEALANTSMQHSAEDPDVPLQGSLAGKRRLVFAGVAAAIGLVALGSIYEMGRGSRRFGIGSNQRAGTSSVEESQPELHPKLAHALQSGFTLVACKGQTKKSWRLDGIHPTPESYPDRTEQHPTTIMFRVKWDATPPFDLFNPQTGDWSNACDRNCIVLGRAGDFDVSKPNQGSADFPGGVAEDLEFHYDGRTAKMRISIAENVTPMDKSDPRVSMYGITHDDSYFSGQCKRVEKYSDLPA